jgi:hypothetical protein
VIVASLLLIVGAVVLLLLGLIGGSSGLLIGSIGTSLLAAGALVIGVRQVAAARAAAGLDEDEDEQYDETEEQQWAPRSEQPVSREAEPLEHWSRTPARAEYPAGWGDESAVSAPTMALATNVPSQVMHDDYDDEDPPDEPVAQRVSASDAARVARMSADVLVIDGRPRYHVPGCVHLLGRPFEPLPVAEAIELGFSPCGLCEPDSALLADARRV